MLLLAKPVQVFLEAGATTWSQLCTADFLKYPYSLYSIFVVVVVALILVLKGKRKKF